MNRNNAFTDEINMSTYSMMMQFKCPNGFDIVFDHLRVSFSAFNTAFLCKNCVKYHYVSQAVCA